MRIKSGRLILKFLGTREGLQFFFEGLDFFPSSLRSILQVQIENAKPRKFGATSKARMR